MCLIYQRLLHWTHARHSHQVLLDVALFWCTRRCLQFRHSVCEMQLCFTVLPLILPDPAWYTDVVYRLVHAHLSPVRSLPISSSRHLCFICQCIRRWTPPSFALRKIPPRRSTSPQLLAYSYSFHISLHIIALLFTFFTSLLSHFVSLYHTKANKW